ncbi:MAG: hypothetical protein ABDH19_05905 [Thermodesulfovibrio sp.]
MSAVITLSERVTEAIFYRHPKLSQLLYPPQALSILHEHIHPISDL